MRTTLRTAGNVVRNRYFGKAAGVSPWSIADKISVQYSTCSESKELGRTNSTVAVFFGLNPNDIDTCPVCQQLLANIVAANGAFAKEDTDTNEDTSEGALIGIWLLFHHGPGLMKAQALEC